jgi:hypothetical protein
MQLDRRLSLYTALILATLNLNAEDYVSVQFMQYDESNDRVSIQAPYIELNKEFGTDYTLNVGFVVDSLSGASPTYVDSSSGASAYSRGEALQKDIKYMPIQYSENRRAVNAQVTKRFKNRDELTVGASYSSESDYYAFESSGEYLHWIDESKNQAISFGLSYQANEVLIKSCKDNQECDSSSGASKKMTNSVLSSEIGFTQVIDSGSLAKVSLFYGYEDGYLSNPYMNVVRNFDTNAKVVAESRPDKRTSFGATLKYIKSLNDRLSFHTKYRFYSDDWGINSNTLNSDLYYDLDDRWTIGGGIRYYRQSEADFYSSFKDSFTDEKYASSDERISDFDAITYKLNLDYDLSKDISVNIGANYYDQGDYFDATYFTLGAKYRF